VAEAVDRMVRPRGDGVGRMRRTVRSERSGRLVAERTAGDDRVVTVGRRTDGTRDVGTTVSATGRLGG
jgi:hypothetical protein